jgi:mRNA-degrading endonuclease YafQ of YafQ-DinJ toxin-antitoxin module
MPGRRVTVVHTTSDFQKSFSRLPPPIKRLAEKKDQWFRTNAFDPRLLTHQLKGPLREYWAYAVNQQYRVLFRFVSPSEVIYYDIGTHTIYRP